MRYKASRFNFRTKGPDGDIILYNSMAGTLSGVPETDREQLEYYLNKNTVVEDPQDVLALDLIEGGYLIEDTTDETQDLFLLMEKRNESSELFISIMPTEDCNFRCVYCFEHFKRGGMSEAIQDGIYGFVRKNLVQENTMYNKLHVNWYGGEPLYAFDVVERLGGKLQDLAVEAGVHFTSSITTNAHLLTPETFEKLTNLGVSVYTITLDGLKQHHQSTRIHRDGIETFDTIIENMKYMRGTKHEFMVQLRSNYTPEAYEDLEGFLDFIKNEFGKDARFYSVDIRPIFNAGGFNEGNFDECVTVHMRNKFKGLQVAKNFGLYNRSLKYYIQPGGIICNASKPNFWMFGSDGKMMRCNIELDNHERNVVGQVQPDGQIVIDYDKLGRWLEAGKDDSGCHKCYFAPSCQGAYCAQKRFDNEENNIMEQPCPTEKKQLAELLRVVYEEMLVLV